MRYLGWVGVLAVMVWLIGCGVGGDRTEVGSAGPGVQAPVAPPQALRLLLESPAVRPKVLPRLDARISQIQVTITDRGGQAAVPTLTFAVTDAGAPLDLTLPNVPVGQFLVISALGLDSSGQVVMDFERGIFVPVSGPFVIRGNITPVADVLSGIVLLQPISRMGTDQASQSLVPQLLADGFQVTPDNLLVYPTSLAAGWKVRVGNQDTTINSDGTFRLVRPDPGILEGQVLHATHQGYQTRFSLADLSQGQRARHAIVVIQPFDGGCKMTPQADEFCTEEVRPRITNDGGRLNPEPGVTTNDCNEVIPEPTEEEQRDRGHYPRPFDLGRSRDDRPVECHQECEQDNGVIRNGSAEAYLGSTCHAFVKAGCCPNENTLSGIFNIVTTPTNFFFTLLSKVTSTVSGGRLPSRAFASVASPADTLTCQDNHKGRECQQTFIGDVSLDFLMSGKGPIIRPSSGYPVLGVRRGEVIDFVVHNNGCFGVTQLQVVQRDIQGRLLRTYRELPFREVPLPQISSIASDKRSICVDPLLRAAPIFGKFKAIQSPGITDVTPTALGIFSGEIKELKHFFASGTLDSPTPCEHYRYFCDIALQYRVPPAAPIGSRDFYTFTVDGCAAGVIFEVLGEDSQTSPQPTPSPSETPTATPSDTPSPTTSPGPSNLISVGPNLSANHTVGFSPCPQQVGVVPVSNLSGEDLSIQMSVDSASLELEQPTSFTLASSSSGQRNLFFNCSTQQSFQATVTIRARRLSDGVEEVEQIPVTMSIQN